MNKRYATLRLLASLLKVSAILAAAVGVFLGSVTITENMFAGAGIIVGGIVSAVINLALGEAITLAIETHKSTRAIERAIESGLPALLERTKPDAKPSDSLVKL